MPVNADIASKMWHRFQQMRDTGHDDYVKKAERCEAFFRGDQWRMEDKAKLKKVGRPYLTINKIKPTIKNVKGEQIRNRAETAFRPRSEGLTEVATALTKVFKQIADNNQLNWKRSQMFDDGIITSRGFLDVRIDKTDSQGGEVRICNVNPKNVVIDPDADEYDPDSWSDVIVTKWYTADDIAVLFSKADAEELRNRDSFFPYGYDSIDTYRDRFGDRRSAFYSSDYDQSNVERTIRVIDRQYRVLDKQKFFVERETGDMRAIPEDFDDNRIAFFTDTFGFAITSQLVRRIKWTVVADNVVLHDEWSPYDHFTIVPYFPDFRYGRTLGMVEDLISPQENLNKVRSQELHVVNSSANGGWKVKTGTLTNMTLEELEERGAQTGLVVEVSDMEGAEKIQPNNTPQGLDRISYKSEEDIKTISGVSDSMQGFDREDVAAKAIQAKQQSGQMNLVSVLDNLNRTDTILARNILCLIQGFYTEERLIAITGSSTTQEPEFLTVNQVTPEGTIINDLTMGEYDVVVTSVPYRDTSEDSQFEQALALREAGVQIPDTVLVKNSRLDNKQEIIKEMTGNQDSPEGQAAAALQQRGAEAEVSKVEAEVVEKQSKAQLNQAKAQEVMNPAATGGADTPTENAKTQTETAVIADKNEHDKQLDYAKLAQKDSIDQQKLQIEAQQAQQEAEDARIQRAQQAAAAAQKPQKPQV
jgi:hypothetical protein